MSGFMTVTSSLRPSCWATPVKVLPALVVEPFFTPAMPLYGVTPSWPVRRRLVLTMSLVFPGRSSSGNCARAVEQYSRKSAFCSPERAKSVRSYALETWSSAS